MSELDPMDRRTFLKTAAVAGAAAAASVGASALISTRAPEAGAQAQAVSPETKIVKNVCHQCPARCGIDVYVTDGKVHATYGTLDHPISNGKLCPRATSGYLSSTTRTESRGRWRTNPTRGAKRTEVAADRWDEALDTIAARLNALRARGEQHRFALVHGRGWGASDAGLLGDFGKLYGTPNATLGHSSICADGSKRPGTLDGNYNYNAYDYHNTNYLLNFGRRFWRPTGRSATTCRRGATCAASRPRPGITVVDVRMTTTGAAARPLLLVKPG